MSNLTVAYPYSFRQNQGGIIDANQFNANFAAVEPVIEQIAASNSPQFTGTITLVGAMPGRVLFTAGLLGSAPMALAMRTLPGSTPTGGVLPKMAGLSAGLSPMTPLLTGRVLVTAQGFLFNPVNCGVHLAYGSGNGPVAGAAATGTTLGLSVPCKGDDAVMAVGLVNLTVGTSYWFDLQYFGVNVVLQTATLMMVEL